MMVYQSLSSPPKRVEDKGLNFYSPSARDLFPLDVAQKRWLESRLQQVFEQWGYHRIITSTLERLDTLMAGGAIQPSAVIQLQDSENQVLGLRPELTASIARAAATRMDKAAYPQRLYYNANVFRRSQEVNHGRQEEFYQAGVELLGGGGLAADAEILLLLADCLNYLHIGPWQLVLGQASLTRSLLSPFPATIQNKVLSGIANLDRVSLENLPLSPELRKRALFMFDLRGNPADVLERVSSLELDSSGQEIVNNLKSLLELLDKSCPSCFPLILDLSLIQTFDYYTGIVFEVVSTGSAGQRVLGQGGRYDQLLSLYHPQAESYPGIGFSLNIEDLQQVLLSTEQLPHETPGSDWLIVANTSDAYVATFAYAKMLRESSDLVRVEINLGDGDRADIQQYACNRRIKNIAWVNADGSIEMANG